MSKTYSKSAVALLAALIVIASFAFAIPFRAGAETASDPCDALFEKTLGEMTGEVPEGIQTEKTRIPVFDAELNEIGYCYSYASGKQYGYIVVLRSEDGAYVAEKASGMKSPYDGATGQAVWISASTHALCRDGKFFLAGSATPVSKDELTGNTQGGASFDFRFDKDTVLKTLDITWKGVLAIFVTITIIIAVSMLLNKGTEIISEKINNKKKPDDSGENGNE